MKTSDYKTLLTSQPEPHILKIEMNRPEAANAFNTQMAYELTDLFEQLSLDAGDCRVVVLTATGSKAFCAGGDLKERNGMTDKAWQAQHLVYERMVRAIMGCPVPIIAAVNGAAYGGGCELAACADFVYASDSAHFAQTEVKLGIIPGAGGTQNLSRAVGERRAKELILTGDVFTSQQAKDWGLVNRVCPTSELQSIVLEAACKIAQMVQWPSDRQNRLFHAECKCRLLMVWLSKLKLTTELSLHKTDEKELLRSMNAPSTLFRGIGL